MGNISLSDPIYQGEGKWFPFEIVDEAGVPIPLTGANFVFQVKQAVTDAAPIFTGVDFDLSGILDGIVKVNLPASQTVQMEEGAYLAQLLVELAPDTDVDISDMVKFKIKKPVVEA